MSTLVTAVKALLAAPRIAKAIDQSPDLRAQFAASIEQVEREMNQVCFAVCKAIVAHAVDREPTDAEVNRLIQDASNDPAFPHRAYRLLGEARKAASWRRRAFLASMVYGLSFKALPDDERDRVDMAVERMMPADLEMLQLVAKRLAAGGCTAYLTPNELRLLPGLAEDGSHSSALRDDAYLADPVALAALQALGCVYLGDARVAMPVWQVINVTTTNVGDLVLRSIDEVRPGLAADRPDGV